MTLPATRVVEIKVLPNDRSRVRIHYFARHDAGPIRQPGQTQQTPLGQVKLGYGVGHIACMPQRKDILPKVEGGVTKIVPHSDDPRAVTCPECMATDEFNAHMARLAELLDSKVEPAAPASK